MARRERRLAWEATLTAELDRRLSEEVPQGEEGKRERRSLIAGIAYLKVWPQWNDGRQRSDSFQEVMLRVAAGAFDYVCTCSELTFLLKRACRDHQRQTRRKERRLYPLPKDFDEWEDPQWRHVESWIVAREILAHMARTLGWRTYLEFISLSEELTLQAPNATERKRKQRAREKLLETERIWVTDMT